MDGIVARSTVEKEIGTESFWQGCSVRFRSVRFRSVRSDFHTVLHSIQWMRDLSLCLIKVI